MNSTFIKEPIIRIIDEDYRIPQLNKRRRVAAILPHNYDNSAKFYPVLYLHDGQNLFDDDAPFGTWGVDKCLAELADKGIEVIVIAIDHGGKDRIAEYLPYDNPKFTESKGELYLKFMMEDLKPYVDRHFRVKTEREHTGIGGSSMGGLISLYAGFNYSNVFGKLMIFSPSIWISEQVYKQAQSFQAYGDTDIYLYAGGREMASLQASMDRLASILAYNKNSHHTINIKSNHNPDGMHQEYFWGQEFPKAMQWLFDKNKLQ
jgi:predicted alpha/beta superfamily hydrolase